MKLKNYFCFLLVALMVTMTSSVFATEASPTTPATGGDVNMGPYLVTDNEDFASSLIGSSMDSFEIVNGVLVATMSAAGTGDPNFGIPLDMFTEEIDCSVYKVCAISLKLSTGGGSGCIYFDTSVNGGLGEDKIGLGTYADSTDWQTVTFDFSKNAKFDGTLTTFRLDPYSSCKDVKYEIKWIAFFKTVEDAQAFKGVFTAAETSAPTTSSTAASTSTSVPTTKPTTTAPTTQPTAAIATKVADGNLGTVIALVAGGIAIVAIVVIIFVKKKKQHH